jgi:hypothetical protein
MLAYAPVAKRSLARKIVSTWWPIVLVAAVVVGWIYRAPIWRKVRVLHAQHLLIAHVPPAAAMACETRPPELAKIQSSPSYQSNPTAALYWPKVMADFPVADFGTTARWSSQPGAYGLVYAGPLTRLDGVERFVVVRIRQNRMSTRYSGNTPVDRVVMWAVVLEPETLRHRASLKAESPTAMCRDYHGGEYAITTAHRDAGDPSALCFDSIHGDKTERLRLRIDNNDRVRVDSKERITP